jgi:hypothetical protein
MQHLTNELTRSKVCAVQQPQILHLIFKAISEKVNAPFRDGKIQIRRSQPFLLDFIEAVYDVVDLQYKDLRRSLVGTGQYRLADPHLGFRKDWMTWINMTSEDKDKLYHKFKKHA